MWLELTRKISDFELKVTVPEHLRVSAPREETRWYDMDTALAIILQESGGISITFVTGLYIELGKPEEVEKIRRLLGNPAVTLDATNMAFLENSEAEIMWLELTRKTTDLEIKRTPEDLRASAPRERTEWYNMSLASVITFREHGNAMINFAFGLHVELERPEEVQKIRDFLNERTATNR